jgi:hypothetical protein
MSQTEQILDRFIESQGWTDRTVLDLLLTYIDNQENHADFEDYLDSLKAVDEEIEPDDWPEEIAHDYTQYDTPEILRDHLVEHHGFVPASARVLFEAGDHHLDTAHQMAHRHPANEENA